jgi:hypothetical protein
MFESEFGLYIDDYAAIKAIDKLLGETPGVHAGIVMDRY